MEEALTPKAIFDQYLKGMEYKRSLGERGLMEQAKINERFFVGDQWYGAQAGNSRPLVRRNFIKRIGEYKISTVCAAPVSVQFFARGTASVTDDEKQNALNAENGTAVSDAEANAVMDALSVFYDVTAERVGFADKCEQILHDAYITGTAFLHTYWDASVHTGQYADERRTVPVMGDIACEVLSVSDVTVGDPNQTDLQAQPYILVSARRRLEDVMREAKSFRQAAEDIRADADQAQDSDRQEENDSKKVTVITKFWKETGKDGAVHVFAVRVTENEVIRPKWDLCIGCYPFSAFTWERRFRSAYGDSEVTYLIPNQIAVNRALTAEVWSVMNTGMPKLVVDKDSVQDAVNNDPGQIVEINAGGMGVSGCLSYLQPPAFTGQFEALIGNMVSNTMADAGANDVALGNIMPENATAIIQMREATLQPMQLYQNRYYAFIEATARIWADFWLRLYGNRNLKQTANGLVSYVPFRAQRYRDLVLDVRVDVGAASLWSESVVVSSLGNLLSAGVITPLQYLERLPKGMIPNTAGLIRDMTQPAADMPREDEAQTGKTELSDFASRYPEQYRLFSSLPEEEQARLLREKGIV